MDEASLLSLPEGMRVEHIQMWDPSISVVSAIISVASVTISPHVRAGFPGICLALPLWAIAQLVRIPKLVSPSY
jgi:hypothetical protein